MFHLNLNVWLNAVNKSSTFRYKIDEATRNIRQQCAKRSERREIGTHRLKKYMQVCTQRPCQHINTSETPPDSLFIYFHQIMSPQAAENK
jgi:hypothetical protein